MDAITLNTIQEITLQAYSFGIYDILFNRDGKPRTEVFQIFRDWAKEFEKIHENTDWFVASFYDEIDVFLQAKKDELTHEFKVGQYIRFEDVVYRITGFTDRGYNVKEICGRFNAEYETIEVGFVAEKTAKLLDDYEEIMDTTNGHNPELVDKINKMWNKNRESFFPILCALYERDIDEITDSDAFQEKEWLETDEYKTACDTELEKRDWTAYNKMALGRMIAEWDFYAYNYLQHIADDNDLECILHFVGAYNINNQ